MKKKEVKKERLEGFGLKKNGFCCEEWSNWNGMSKFLSLSLSFSHYLAGNVMSRPATFPNFSFFFLCFFTIHINKHKLFLFPFTIMCSFCNSHFVF